jgi:hypothetical protein
MEAATIREPGFQFFKRHIEKTAQLVRWHR